MLISIHDKSLKRVAFLDNDKPGTLHFYNDTWHRYLVEATSTFDFTVPKPLETHSDLAFLTEKNYISFRYGNEDYLFNIMKVVETEDALTCSCENLNLELLNETASEYKASGAKPFVDYFNDPFLVGGADYTDLVIGINEISDYRRTLSWEGNDTKLARLLSIVKQFDAECEFETKLNRDGTLDKIVLNVYKAHSESNQGVGRRRNDVTLYYSKEIKSVRRTVDKTGLYTAIRPIGKDGLTIASIPDRVVNDANGKPLYTKAAGTSDICAPQSATEYPPQMSSKKDSWILLYWSYDTDNPETLYSKGLAKLKSVCLPAITYEAEGSLALDIGDTVIIHDAKFAPTLLLEARVSEQEVSFSDPTKNKNVFANFRALENQLSSDITSQLATIVENALPYTMEVLSSDGLVFKNGEGSTTLTPRVLKGQKDVTDQVVTTWQKNGMPTGISGAITITAADIADKAVYKVAATSDAGTVLCTSDVTIVDISDGRTGPPGKDGTDVQAVTIYYLLQASTLSAPVAPTIEDPTNWSATEPAFDNTTTKTLYTCVRTLYKNGTFNWGDVSVSSGYEAARNAYNAAQAAQNTADGKNTVYRQSSPPSGGTYKSGDVWFDTANGNAIYTYSGSAWVKNEMGSAAIAANAIVAGLIASNAITTDKLAANSVSTAKLATDAIKSLNYSEDSAGMFLNLSDGSIDAPNFKVDSSGKVTATDGNFSGLLTATGGSFTGNVSIFGQTNTMGMFALISEGKRVYNSSIQTYDNYTYNYITKLDGTGLNIMFSGRKGTSPDYDTIETVPDETSWNDVCKISARAEYGTGGSSFSSSKHPFVEMLLKNYAGLYIRDDNVDIAYWDYSQAYFNVPMRILESTGHIGYVMHGDNQHETDPASSNYMGHKYYCCWVASDLKLHFYVDGTDIGNVSDKRLKKNIDSINSSYLKAIGSVDLKQFNITRNLMDNDKLFLGAIAQELQDKLAENNIEDDTYSILGTTNNGPNDLDSEGKENEYLSIDYEQFLLARLAYDESKISELESRIEALENKMS